MEKKKLKLSISGSNNKTISSIEQAKNKSKNTVVIEKKSKRFFGKTQNLKPNLTNDERETEAYNLEDVYYGEFVA